jgi:hypothetical protein
MTTQPAIRWIPTGPHAGIYLWTPTFRNWRHTKLVPGGIEDRTVEHLPPGSTPLVALTDVGEALDLYRDQLDACTCPDSEQHADVKATVLTEVSDAADLALYEPDGVQLNDRR